MSNSPSHKVIKSIKLVHKVEEILLYVNNNETLPKEIVDIVKSYSKRASIFALVVGAIPLIGGIIAFFISAGFTLSMYTKINKKIGLTLSENMIKTIKKGVFAHIKALLIIFGLISSAMSLFPGIGTIGSSTIICITVYLTTYLSGSIYLESLSKLFIAGEDPNKLSKEDWEKEYENNNQKNNDAKCKRRI